MARAKRTDRTEARRRHRAEQAASGVELAAEGLELAESPSTRRRGGAEAPAGGNAPAVARPSMMRAIRGAVHPLDLRGDLRALPEILRHRSNLVAVGVAVVAVVVTGLYVSATNELGASLDFSQADPAAGKTFSQLSSISYSLMPMFVTPPPLAGALFVGFFAKRGSWLLGLLYGLVAAACYSVVVATPAGRLFTAGGNPAPFIVQAWVIGPIGAALFASAAAWYRRFLDLINPSRGRRPAQGQAKPVQGRGNVPRNRLSGQGRR